MDTSKRERADVKTYKDLKIKLYADGASLGAMIELAQLDHVQGLTTNPTLMRQSGVTDYVSFAYDVLEAIPNKPISFEVFADTADEILRQARLIASWGKNVYVKIPVSMTDGSSCAPLVGKLAAEGVKLNVTALFTPTQVEVIAGNLNRDVPSIISVFAGRIADAGCDPMPLMAECREILADIPSAELLWASSRELFNIVQADEVGCHIITVTPDLLKKLPSIGKDLDEFSLDTVKMFFNDATAAGYRL